PTGAVAPGPRDRPGEEARLAIAFGAALRATGPRDVPGAGPGLRGGPPRGHLRGRAQRRQRGRSGAVPRRRAPLPRHRPPLPRTRPRRQPGRTRAAPARPPRPRPPRTPARPPAPLRAARPHRPPARPAGPRPLRPPPRVVIKATLVLFKHSRRGSRATSCP